MSRELPTLQPTAQSSSKQLNTMVRRTQLGQVKAMVRMADRLVANIEQEGLTALIQGFQKFAVEYATTLDNANQTGQCMLQSHTVSELQRYQMMCEQAVL